ncbi:MAG: glycosidase, partial [Pedobacter sp.]|nr:glycosidase [Pedobacter sp.]
MKTNFEKQIAQIAREQEELIMVPNIALPNTNGLFKRYQNPVLTAAHVPYFWKYDLNPLTNPF